MSTYSRADTSIQWYQDDYPGADLNLTPETMVVVLHTTESSGWPGYGGGTSAPNYTYHPMSNQWRAHFPDEKSSRALRNLSGGVETNTLNSVQVELIGTCDPRYRERWGDLVAGQDYVFWPNATDVQLLRVAQFLADLHKRHGLKLRAPKPFIAYPASYGEHDHRMTFAEWRNAVGVVGHQHVPENSHGDPGNIAIERILDMAEKIVKPKADDTKIPVAGLVLSKGPSDHAPFVKDFWFSARDESRFRVGFWNLNHGTNANEASPLLSKMKKLGCGLLILNEVKRSRGILELLRGLGYEVAYNDPEFCVAWLPRLWEDRWDRDLVLSEHDYWLSRNEALLVRLEHKPTGRELKAISEHLPAHIVRRDHPTFENVLEVHKDAAQKNAKLAERTPDDVAILIGRDSNIDPKRDRPVYRDTWDWAYKGYDYVRSPDPTHGGSRHIDEFLTKGLRSRPAKG
jgi:hypothetical protein